MPILGQRECDTECARESTCTKMLNPYLEPYTCKNVGIERAHYSVEIKDTEAQQLWMRG